ncbi:MAG: Brp/Blh family beta-carotene 15,15'-dioxygenase [Haliea sp.]|nr:Brp/Blh family beta-carotene 15,15'-dioxygenase [Haliea sp.]
MTERINATPETWLFLGLGGLALLLAHQETLPFSNQALAIVLAVAVVLTGLPHGALDPWVAWRAGLWRTWAGFAGFNLVYMAAAAGVVAVWQLAPGASLALFLAISAWHFGGDWRKDLNVWGRVMAGSALLALPALGAPAEVSALFTLLAGEQGGALASSLGMAAPWLAAVAAAAAVAALRRSTVAAVELAAVAAFALLLPPLVFFLVYFCALHSPRHLRNAARSAVSGQRQQMVGVALIYTGLTVVAAAFVWPWLAEAGMPTATLENNLLRLVFIGLAALTLPHMIVVMFSEQRDTSLP